MSTKKSQIISMDFILAFLGYTVALAFFFFYLTNALGLNQEATLNVPAELLFNRLDQAGNEEVDFLEGAKIDGEKLDYFLDNYDYSQAYELWFKDFENPAFYSNEDYCVYLEKVEQGHRSILRNFGAGSREEYTAIMGRYDSNTLFCGANKTLIFENFIPFCDRTKKTDSLLLTKPVLYRGDIVNLKVLICAQKR